MSKATALILYEVLAILALEIELAELSLDLLFPGRLCDRFVRSE